VLCAVLFRLADIAAFALSPAGESERLPESSLLELIQVGIFGLPFVYFLIFEPIKSKV